LQFKKAGYEVVIASPAGGSIPIDKNSMGDGFFTDAAKKFMHDGDAIGQLCHSTKLESINFADVDAIFFCGGHGTCVDFHANATVKSSIETMYAANKIVAAVCHGQMALPQCNKADGTPLVQGKVVTAFKDSEEIAVALQDKVPFLLESKLKEQGAKYESADDWNSKVCVDGKLVTGQNPQSSEACAAAVISLLS
jgi:putative intracellular protease/amidase